MITDKNRLPQSHWHRRWGVQNADRGDDDEERDDGDRGAEGAQALNF